MPSRSISRARPLSTHGKQRVEEIQQELRGEETDTSKSPRGRGKDRKDRLTGKERLVEIQRAVARGRSMSKDARGRKMASRSPGRRHGKKRKNNTDDTGGKKSREDESDRKKNKRDTLVAVREQRQVVKDENSKDFGGEGALVPPVLRQDTQQFSRLSSPAAMCNSYCADLISQR